MKACIIGTVRGRKDAKLLAVLRLLKGEERNRQSSRLRPNKNEPFAMFCALSHLIELQENKGKSFDVIIDSAIFT